MLCRIGAWDQTLVNRISTFPRHDDFAVFKNDSDDNPKRCSSCRRIDNGRDGLADLQRISTVAFSGQAAHVAVLKTPLDDLSTFVLDVHVDHHMGISPRD